MKRRTFLKAAGAFAAAPLAFLGAKKTDMVVSEDIYNMSRGSPSPPVTQLPKLGNSGGPLDPAQFVQLRSSVGWCDWRYCYGHDVS